MCGSNPELAPEVNKAKCIAGNVLGFGIVTLLGFAVPGGGGILPSIGGLLGLIAGSILCCCGPKTKGTGGGQHMAAAVLGILAAILHIVGAILVIVAIIAVNTAVAGASGAVSSACDDACDQSYGPDMYTEDECNSYFGTSCADQIASCKETCGGAATSGAAASVQAAAQTGALVLTLALGLPTIIFAVLCFGLEVALAVFCFKARTAIAAEGGGPTVQGNKQ